MLRIASVLALVVAAAAVAVGTSQADHGKKKQSFPDVIQLPTGFQPEGIEIGKGTTFYVGSVATGDIYKGDLRTGKRIALFPGQGRSATGIELAGHDRLIVAGASSGN